MATDEGNSRNEIWHWINYEVGVVVQSWTHDLIAQSVRASERNTVVAGSNGTQNSTFFFSSLFQTYLYKR